MVAKPAEPQNGKITALEKENAEMKAELEFIRSSGKANNIIWSIVWAIIVYVASTTLFKMAKIGLQAASVEPTTGIIGGALLSLIIAVSYLTIVTCLLWTTVIHILNICQDDFRQLGERLIVFCRGGANALKEKPADPDGEAVPTQNAQKSLIPPS